MVRSCSVSAVVNLGLAAALTLSRAARVAGGLRALGIECGDRVAIRLPNGLSMVRGVFGIQLAGAVAVPVNTRFSEARSGLRDRRFGQ